MAYLIAVCAFFTLLTGGDSDGSGSAAPITPSATPSVAPSLALDAGYDDGFYLRSRDGDQELVIGGLIQTRAQYSGPDRTPSSQFDLQRARLEFVGRFEEHFRFALEPRFGAHDFELEEGWVGVELGSGDDMLRIGRMKAPFGLEEVRSRRHIPFAQFSILSQFYPAEQHGIFYSGADGDWEWNAAIYNGGGGEETNDGKELALRGMWRPFTKRGDRGLRNLAIGAAVTMAREDREVAGDSIDNALGLPLATYVPGVRLDGNDRRAGLEFAWFDGPNMLQSEIMFTRQTLTLSGGQGRFDKCGTYLSAQHVLSGEDISFKGPAIGGKSRGTWVAAARISYLSLDPLYRESGVIGAKEGGDSITTLWAGMNYYFNEHVLLRNSLVYSHYENDVIVDGERIYGEPALLFELQFHF